MTIAYWIVAGITALLFLAAGGVKLISSEASLKSKGMLPDRRSLAQERVIGVVEVVGALGLILPPLTGIAVILAPIAAVGLVITMVIAILNHRSHQEPVVGPIGPGTLALASAVLGFVVWL